MIPRRLISSIILSLTALVPTSGAVAIAAEDGSSFFRRSWRPPETLPDSPPAVLYPNKLRAKFIGEATDGIWADEMTGEIQRALDVPELRGGKVSVSCRMTMCQVLYYEANIAGDLAETHAKRQDAIARAFVKFTKDFRGGVNIIVPEYMNHKDGLAILAYYDKNETE